MKALIEIEGLDGCFKSTNTEMLINYFKEKGFSVYYLHFPRYESPTGKLIGDRLKSGWGDLTMFQRFIMYANDRDYAFNKDPETMKRIEECDILICDRYVGSTMMYQTTECGFDIDKALEKIVEIEYGMNKLPRPMLTIYLRNPNFNQFMALNNRSAETSIEDVHEKDKEYQNKIWLNSNYIAKKYNWKIIDIATEERYKLKSEIADEIKKLADLEIEIIKDFDRRLDEFMKQK